MTIMSVRAASTRFCFLPTLLVKAAWRWLPKRAGRALLRALHDSRQRAAIRVLRDNAHLISDDGNATRERSTPRK